MAVAHGELAEGDPGVTRRGFQPTTKVGMIPWYRPGGDAKKKINEICRSVAS
jgi:hypothetical protein